jgi:hypothetical protein
MSIRQKNFGFWSSGLGVQQSIARVSVAALAVALFTFCGFTIRWEASQGQQLDRHHGLV